MFILAMFVNHSMITNFGGWNYDIYYYKHDTNVVCPRSYNKRNPTQLIYHLKYSYILVYNIVSAKWYSVISTQCFDGPMSMWIGIDMLCTYNFDGDKAGRKARMRKQRFIMSCMYSNHVFAYK